MTDSSATDGTRHPAGSGESHHHGEEHAGESIESSSKQPVQTDQDSVGRVLPSIPLSTRLLRGLLGLAAIGITLGSLLYFSPRMALAWIQPLNRPGYVLAVLALIYLIRPFLAIPMSILTVFVGFQFGPIVGFPVAISGTLVTCLIPFWVARHGIGVLPLASDAGEIGDRVLATTGETGGITAARLSPAPADVVSAGAGLSTTTTSSYALGTVLGEIPWTIAYLLLGASIERLTPAAFELGTMFLLTMAVLAGLSFIIAVWRSGRSP